ncbi:hypothetical protein BOTBODRAFT_469085 [Botryobasidium botryosum FD-172 SS1]|uniref:Amine oxidase domain-containing protein n=1 Tax=Botryobasidium botryosum (strain FD-172 SS1) TaxID=930990 RepID=A0A067M5B6_BOTB1|nr:hypothetical protein BOTBODRAFT_469085 [Botryobasidium botryosum FD-172 SS1]
MSLDGQQQNWRAKFAREYVKIYQRDQVTAHNDPPIATPGQTGGFFTTNDHLTQTALPDRPPLHPIPVPAPIIGPNYPMTGEEVIPHVGIIGAGAAGLYTAMILDSLDIPYDILEASTRIGGRINTYHFQGSGSDNAWNYFDIGAMRYPEIDIMYRVFDLFRVRLKIGDKLVPYKMSHDNQVLDFNSVRHLQKDIGTPRDWFRDSTENQGLVPPKYVNAGVAHWLEECFQPFKDALVFDWKQGWELLMRYDQHSARSFMRTEIDEVVTLHKVVKGQKKELVVKIKKDAYPDAAINWLERMNTGTGLFDMAFSEMVIDDLQFDWPASSKPQATPKLAACLKYGGDCPTDEDGSPKWYCLAGGSEVFIKAMVEKIRYKPMLSKRVTDIFPTANDKPIAVTYVNNRISSAPRTKHYDYVISTLPLPSLRLVNIDKCNPSYAQTQALRTLRYDSSVKVALKFRTRWWQTLEGDKGIIGGQTKTDRVVRTVVYPSYGIDDPKADAVMIASYTWSQDAQRIASLVNGPSSTDEKLLVELILNDLAVMHGLDPDFLHDELEDFMAWDWSSSQFSLGAFALFGPGQFGGVYASWGQSVAGGRVIFAGEALSEQHAWVEGALDSAYWAVHKMLCGARLETKLSDLHEKWGNKKISEKEEQEQNLVMLIQESNGALLSSCDDRKKLADKMLRLD